MDAAMLYQNSEQDADTSVTTAAAQIVDVEEFRRLLVSHRRMVRADRRHEQLRGLKDVDTGELFLVDERRLLDAAW